jgi:hypothetical protein
MWLFFLVLVEDFKRDTLNRFRENLFETSTIELLKIKYNYVWYISKDLFKPFSDATKKTSHVIINHIVNAIHDTMTMIV